MLTYAERIEKAGYEVKECKTMKEFYEELKTYDKETEENPKKDIAIEVYYKNGETFCYYPYITKEGTIKNSGIKTAIIVTKTGYITYKYDLSEEWEKIKEKLSEEEAEAIELGISIENYRIYKKTADNFHKTEAEEQETAPAEETTKSTKNSAFRYKINILEVLKKSGYTSTRIRKEKIFAQVTLQKFRTGDTNISLQTVADICNLTGLQPWDILSFSEKTTEEPKAEKQEATPEEETAKSTEISAEEETEEITEEFLNSILIDVETEIAKLPDLFETGSEKQIAWAENIRRDAYMYLNNIITNAVILGYDVESRKPIYIDSERYKNGTECNIDGNHYNSKKIIDSVMQVKQCALGKFFMEKCQTAPKIIENRYRIESKEIRRYITNCYKHM